FNVATTLGSNNFDEMTYLLIVAVYYLVLVALLTIVVSLVEKRLAVSE
ncbi:TPA: amino acid ABC transporter permease, partial [Escherichia coli]|nr:amino acid ABC transporter permease [Escherichia coli]